jgi:hypothetical protein
MRKLPTSVVRGKKSDRFTLDLFAIAPRTPSGWRSLSAAALAKPKRYIHSSILVLMSLWMLCGYSLAQGSRYDAVAQTSASVAGVSLSTFVSGATVTACSTSGIATTSETGTTVTVTTSSAHGLSVGQSIKVYGVGVSGYNGTWTVATTPTSTTFTYVDNSSGLGASSGGGVAPNNIPCTPVATVYTDQSLQIAASNPTTTDTQGNYGFWLAPGTYVITVNGTGVASTLYMATLAAGAGPDASLQPSSIKVSNPGAFTDTQMNVYLQGLINGASPATEFSAAQGGHFATEGLTGAVLVPVGATVHQANGVAGYVQNNSSSMPLGGAVAVYGQSRCLANSTFCWGGNPVAISGAGLTGVNLQGLEVDVNAHSADVAWGISITGASSGGTPSNSIALYVRPMGLPTNQPWQNGLLFQDAATAASGAAVFLGPVGVGNSVSSQNFIIEGRDAGGVVRPITITADLNGQLVIAPPNSQNVKVNGPGGIVGRFFQSDSSNPAASGQLRLASGDAIGFRNNANGADVLMGKNASDQFTFASGLVITGSVNAQTLTVTTATPTGIAGQISFGDSTSASATAGSNGAVPAQVAGYLVIDNGGTKQKIPYFNN